MALGKSEAAFWARLRKGLLSANRHILFDRIESPGTSRGIPDVHMTDPEYGDCWLELKVIASGNRVPLTQLQVQWNHRRARIGSRCRIVILLKPANEIMIYNGLFAPQLFAQGLRFPPVSSSTPPYDWERIREDLYYAR